LIIQLYQEAERGETLEQISQKLSRDKDWQSLLRSAERDFPEGSIVLNERELISKIETLLLKRKVSLDSKYDYRILSESFIEKMIPSTQIYGEKKYYHDWVKGKVENVVPHFHPLRHASFCPEGPFYISEDEIPYAEVGGEKIKPEALLNPYICPSELPEKIKEKTENYFFPLRNSNLALKKEVENYCFPEGMEGENKRCKLYYHPLEVGDFSQKIKERQSLDIDIVPELILGDNKKFSSEAEDIFDIYIKSELYYILVYMIKYIFLLQCDIGIYGYGDEPGVFKEQFKKKNQIVVGITPDGKSDIFIPPNVFLFDPELSQKKIFLLEIQHIYYHTKRPSHAVSVLIDKEAKTYEFFGPRGDEAFNPEIGALSLEAVKRILPVYSFLDDEYCPRFGPQALSDLNKGGFCYLWNFFYAENYIIARRKWPAEVFRQISFNRLLRDKLLQTGGPSYISRVIISYLCYKFYQIASLYRAGEFKGGESEKEVFLRKKIAETETLLKKSPLYVSYTQALELYQGNVLNYGQEMKF